jgi:hypothetical protein
MCGWSRPPPTQLFILFCEKFAPRFPAQTVHVITLRGIQSCKIPDKFPPLAMGFYGHVKLKNGSPIFGSRIAFNGGAILIGGVNLYFYFSKFCFKKDIFLKLVDSKIIIKQK